MCAALVACAPSYTIRPLIDGEFPPSKTVEVIYEAPARPFLALAAFEGRARQTCPEEQPYCDLLPPARELGADAVWVRQESSYTQPSEWIMLDGRLTKIHSFTIKTVAGVFIRYQANEEASE